jgi:hypothetical protein
MRRDEIAGTRLRDGVVRQARQALHRVTAGLVPAFNKQTKVLIEELKYRGRSVGESSLRDFSLSILAQLDLPYFHESSCL